MKIKVLFVALLANITAFAQTQVNDSIAQHYAQVLDVLAQARETAAGNAAQNAETVALNPYFYRLMAPGTYYNRSLHEVMGIDWEPTVNEDQESTGEQQNLVATSASDQALARLYVNQPSLVARTESALKETTALREDASVAPLSVTPKLAEKAVAVDLDTDVADTITFIPKKPNFWKFKGSVSLQFTQSYFSDNWYQGGENNYLGIGMLTLEANYDNQQKIQWDNKLEAQLGFQTTTSDDYHKFRVTSNLLRLTSKLGYKAAKNWFYTGQVMSYTQLAPYYEKNTREWKANFATPLYLTVSVGMDYKYKSKNEKVDLSVYLSPLAYYMTYVNKFHSTHFATDEDGNPLLDGDGYIKYDYWYPITYGMEHRDEHFLHRFGPNFTVNSKIVLMKNVTWTSRLYWFTNFHSTLIEWENKLDFTINKYLNATFYAYPRFDDSSIAYRNRHKNRGRYLMFKEWLSLGLSYNF